MRAQGVRTSDDGLRRDLGNRGDLGNLYLREVPILHGSNWSSFNNVDWIHCGVFSCGEFVEAERRTPNRTTVWGVSGLE